MRASPGDEDQDRADDRCRVFGDHRETDERSRDNVAARRRIDEEERPGAEQGKGGQSMREVQQAVGKKRRSEEKNRDRHSSPIERRS